MTTSIDWSKQSIATKAGCCLLLGLGNELLTDDGVGLRAVEAAAPLLVDEPGVVVAQSREMGLALLDLVVGYERLVLVDSILTGNRPPGYIHKFGASALQLLPGFSPHFLGVGEMLALGKELGLTVPTEVLILAVEVADPYTVSTQMTPVIETALPAIVQRVVEACREATEPATCLATSSGRPGPDVIRS